MGIQVSCYDGLKDSCVLNKVITYFEKKVIPVIKDWFPDTIILEVEINKTPTIDQKPKQHNVCSCGINVLTKAFSLRKKIKPPKINKTNQKDMAK